MNKTLIVRGKPQPKGSMRWLPAKVVIDQNASNIMTYATAIQFAWDSHPTRIPEPTEEPILLHLVFTFERPKLHYKSVTKTRGSGILKDVVPVHFNRTPDTDKLCRAVCDALTGRAYKDDKQVVQLHAVKLWGAAYMTSINVMTIIEHDDEDDE